MTQTVARMPDAAWGNIRVGGEGSVKLKRTDFGILGGEFWGKALADANAAAGLATACFLLTLGLQRWISGT